MIKSESTGNWFCQVSKCNIIASFGEPTAKAMLGQSMCGSIVKVDCEPYTYKIPNTGEEKVLNYTYEYVEDDVTDIQSEAPF